MWRLKEDSSMSSGKNALLDAARAVVCNITSTTLATRLNSGAHLVFDVRETDEVSSGRIPGAVHVPRGLLELRIESLAPTQAPVTVYCASGVRSLLAAKTLREMGYSDVSSLEGGFDAWKADGRPVDIPPSLSAQERQRYARQLNLPELGEEGQLKLRRARVLLIGAGGLGSPAALYLAGAGVGTIGVIDDDRVDLSNLQRQVLHRTQDAGQSKVESAARAISDLNPEVTVETYPVRFEPTNADKILDKNWTLIVDGTDRIPARYLINDKAVEFGLPVVYAAIHRFEGQITVFSPRNGGPCYRCLFPTEPPPELAPSCAEAGVIGALPGILGTLQALEALKIILGVGQPLLGRLLRFDGLNGTFDILNLPKDPTCPVCA